MEEEADEDTLKTRPSVVIPYLQDSEQHFFEIVAYGNVADVKQFLEGNPNFNVNIVDFQGVTALHIAVHDRNMPMVEYLLSQPDVDPGDTHLHAIRDNEMKITMVILNKLNELSPGLEYASVSQSSDFPDYSTPLAVAAQCGHFEMISFLRKRNHILPRPHPPSCNCEEICKRDRDKYDLLTIERMRLYAYKAITNPAYICQTVDDPILEAFNLSYELIMAASFDKEFYHDYLGLAKTITQFATDLISCARTVDEVEIVLKQSTGFAHSSKFLYPRLLFALHNKQRTFVAHPNVQQLISSKWIDGWYEWKIMGLWKKLLTILLRIFVLPVILIVVMVAPHSKISKFWQSPVNKFISSTASYLMFLFVVFLMSNADKSEQLRGPPNSAYTWILIIYVTSYTWGLIRLCIIHGPKRFFAGPWYWFEMIMIFLFILTFLYWITAAVDVRIHGQLELERKYWNEHDPTLIAEGIFCLATIMAFLKLLYVCQLDYYLGPLQLSLGKMIKDVVKFIFLFSIIILAFTAGTCKLYQYYDEMVQIDDESKIKTQQVSSFVNFSAALKTLFWALFCMSPIESADVIIENLPGESENETIVNHHTFTEIIGYISFAGFTFIGVIVILNMLIACMSNTLTNVTENVIVEWTFARTETYVDFMLTTTLPPPFNIVPTIIGIQPVIEYVKVLLKPPTDKRARWDTTHCCFIETLESSMDNQFSLTMSQLVQRYFRKKDKELDENEMERLTKEIVDLRNLLREALTTE
ncbi:PREDICTED: short transient receptor potential channel 4-like [Habropoda laboriosa]|uniref:short transient receptor potential channel 4-like n=1 Tax=Habropoda laboriosa TaxID=597456 RepID=UPI00083CDF59|nr:PREDICTED: short transient receptor potential channel 4-like [Habropoda laboriosa]